MSATITWTIQWMQAYPQEDGLTDVVISAGWACTGVQPTTESGPIYTYVGNGTSNFTLDPSQPFTPYAQLTQEQVLGWVWAGGVDKDLYEAAVQKGIDDQINPPIIQPPLPWVTPSA